MSAPQSLLARYRQLAPNASVRVSPLCLGSMTFGQAGSAIQGETTLAESTAIIDAFYKAGGNFIDTANGYVNFPANNLQHDTVKQDYLQAIIHDRFCSLAHNVIYLANVVVADTKTASPRSGWASGWWTTTTATK